MTFRPDRRIPTRFMALALWLSMAIPSAPAAADEPIAASLADQRRTQQVAQELVATVIDAELARLEQNGLAGDPAYARLRGLRGEIHRIAEDSMAEVVLRMREAERADGTSRQQKYAAARAARREVVLELERVRGTLVRRVRAADLRGRLEQLAALQDRALEKTRALASLPAVARADAIAGVLADQRDIRAMFGRFTLRIEEMNGNDKPLARAALTLRNWMAQSGLSGRFAPAEKALEQGKAAESLAAQERLVADFQDLARQFEAALRSRADWRQLLDTVRELRDQQRALHEETSANQASSMPLELVERQRVLAERIAALNVPAEGNPGIHSLWEESTAAVRGATEALFENETAGGLRQQSQTIDRLDALGDLLAVAMNPRRDRSAAEFAKAIAELTTVRDRLARIMSDLDEGDRSSRSKEADRLEALISQLGDAPATAARLNGAVADLRAGKKVRDSLERGAAALAGRIADWQRAAIGVRAGELARAAEALERAAAARRSLADSGRLRPQERDIRETIREVARNTAEGIRASSPAAARRLDEFLSKNVSGSLPGANQDSHHAAVPANLLGEAAAALRREIGESSEALFGIIDEQSRVLERADQAVEAARDAATSNDPADLRERTRRARESAIASDLATTIAAQTADDFANVPKSSDAAAALERAAESLAARRRQLEAARDSAARLGSLGPRQQEAIDTMNRARGALEDAPNKPGDMSSAERQAAAEMRSAADQFAATQQETGRAAVAISGQRQLANEAIRSALAAAGRLPRAMAAPSPSTSEPEGAEPSTGSDSGEDAARGQASETEQADSSPGENDAAESPGMKAASSGAGGQNQAGSTSSKQGQAEGRAMGTGMVPSAADETARMIAGSKAEAAMSALDEAARAASEATASGQGASVDASASSPTNNRSANESAESQSSGKGPGGQTGQGASSSGQGNRGGESPRPIERGGRSDEGGWFTKLPPDVRAAIRANASRPAPPGYERRLKRYFESTEPE